jgi:hypothetical protein
MQDPMNVCSNQGSEICVFHENEKYLGDVAQRNTMTALPGDCSLAETSSCLTARPAKGTGYVWWASAAEGTALPAERNWKYLRLQRQHLELTLQSPSGGLQKPRLCM